MIGASPPARQTPKPTLDCKEQLSGIENGDSEEQISVVAGIANQLPHDMHQVTRQSINAVKLVSRSGCNRSHKNESKF